jgi:methionyl-tRNA formyltransferase
MSDTKLRIVFMGTPDFAVASLDILVQNGYNIVGVVTSPDKPAGRGLEVQQSAVKKYALKKKLNNLHASLLPQYRGAAPINWAVMNGESETGVTTFFLKHEIDTGKIIYREKVGISENESAGELHDKLMNVGAQLVLKTVQSIETGTYKEIEQDQFLKQDEVLKHAPKIFKNDCKIDWNLSIDQIHNKIRGLSPYPAAFTELVSPEGKMFSVKLFKTTKETDKPTTPIVSVSSDSKSYIKVSVKEGYICLHELQLAGKKRMNVTEFLRGFPLTNGWKVQ